MDWFRGEREKEKDGTKECKYPLTFATNLDPTSPSPSPHLHHHHRTHNQQLHALNQLFGVPRKMTLLFMLAHYLVRGYLIE